MNASQVPTDHTRVMIARLKKRRVSVDYLAPPAGLMRPDFQRDPVHLTLAAVSVARTHGE